MKRFTASLFALALSASAGSAQVPNVQFKDLDGKSYDLYTVLNRGTNVYMQVVTTW